MSDRPLRILHLTAGSDAGGLSRYVHDLSVAMIAGGHEVKVAGERGAWHWLFERSPIEWIDVPLKGGPWDLGKAVYMLRKRLRHWPVDVVHCHYRRPTLVSRGLQLAGARARSGRRLPVLYTLHLSHLGLSWGRRLASDFGDHTHVASVEAEKWLVEEAHVRPDRVSLIPHGVDVAKWPVTTPETRAEARAQLGLSPDDRVAAYVGRLDYPKNCDWLLDVAARWPAAPSSPSRDPLAGGDGSGVGGGGGGELRILLAGEGPDFAPLCARLRHEGLADRVRLLGHREPLAVYRAADLLLLPSLREGFSLVVAEAMCTGLPALRTRTSGTAELIVEDVTGRSVPIDHDAFVTAAVDLLADAPALARMRDPAAAHIRARFSFDRQLDETLALYHRLTGS